MSATAAIHALRRSGVTFSEHPYAYEARGGTRTAARELAIDQHAIVKTLVMQDETAAPLIVLMHGDRQVSTKALARQIGRKAIEPCTPAAAQRHTGYMVGGISPFGIRKRLPVFVDRSILDLDAIFINGGRRGLLVRIAPQELTRVLDAVPVDTAIT